MGTRGLTSATALALFLAAGSARAARTVDIDPAPNARTARPTDVAVPLGYKVEAVATGLTYPTDVVFDDHDGVFVVEAGYAFGGSWTTPRLLRLEPDDRFTIVAQGDRNGPWTGAVFYKGYFYVAEGGQLDGGRILRVDPDTGRAQTLVSGLPSRGDNPTQPPAIGPDGRLYFGQGTATNAGVVGDDNSALGWVSRAPDAHDIPCRDVTLSGRNYPTAAGDTGAFQPAGTPSTPSQVVRGQVPCSGAIFSLPLVGAPTLELVAWGFRDPTRLAFDPKGRLFALDDGYEERGSRPVWGAADLLWAVSTGTWYGWPDYSGGRPVNSTLFAAAGRESDAPVLARAPGKPPRPAVELPVHSSAHGLDFSRSDDFGHVGEAFVAEFGDLSPFAGQVYGPVGYKVVRVDLATGVIDDFAVNKGPTNGPASRLGTSGFERPVAVRFSPDGDALYVVDFGTLRPGADGAEAVKGSGVLWRIKRDE